MVKEQSNQFIWILAIIGIVAVVGIVKTAAPASYAVPASTQSVSAPSFMDNNLVGAAGSDSCECRDRNGYWSKVCDYGDWGYTVDYDNDRGCSGEWSGFHFCPSRYDGDCKYYPAPE